MSKLIQKGKSVRYYDQFHISQAIQYDNLLFISGQCSIDQNGNVLFPNNFELQIEQAFINLQNVLEDSNSSIHNVIKVTIFLKDMKYFKKVVECREKYFTKPYPADSIVEINRLYHDELFIEIEAISYINE